ncbi:Delta-like protein 4 [Halocaridina rubra]|uniref:Delta-like protein 4 n=1 Tax=Halocaridina rubra TaxID=373956 RepID=A0AAN8XS56_HALRR
MRWLLQPMAILLVMVVAAVCVTENSATAVFELRLKKFVNQYGKDTEGHCCSGYRNSQGLCSGTCKTKFRVCLKVYQEVIDPNSNCTFGEAVTPVLGENEVDFTKADLGDFVNPVKFQLSSWQGTFSLIIEAWHEEPNDTLSYAVQHSKFIANQMPREKTIGDKSSGTDGLETVQRKGNEGKGGREKKRAGREEHNEREGR